MEVFKRDSFTCQYCGKSAPTVILHVDHIKPHSKGGSDDIINLITSCRDCNLGKSDRELDDDTAVRKSQKQAELLNERRQQMEMMMVWHEELKDLDQVQVDKVAEYWASNVPGLDATVEGKKTLKKLLKKYGLAKLLQAIDTATEQYIRLDENKNVIKETAEIAFKKVGGILKVEEVSDEKPYLRRLFYIRGILRNRLSYLNEWQLMPLLEQAAEADISVDWIERQAKTCNSWTAFRNVIEDALNQPNQEHEDVEEDKPEDNIDANKRPDFRTTEIDIPTKLTGASVDLEMSLMENYGFEDEQAHDLTSGLRVLSASFEEYLKRNYIDKSINAVNEALYDYILESAPFGMPLRILSTHKPYHQGFQDLNSYLFNYIERDIPFVYHSYSTICQVMFPNRDTYIAACQHLAGLDKQDNGETAYNMIQRESYNKYSVASLIQTAILASITLQFERCGLKPRGEDVARLLKYYEWNDVLDVLGTWMAKWDDNGEILSEFDEEKDYEWEGFLTELSVNVEPKLEVLISANLDDYHELFRGNNAYFRGFYLNDEGIICSEMFEGWDKFSDLTRGETK
jgi:hypothetical protein